MIASTKPLYVFILAAAIGFSACDTKPAATDDSTTQAEAENEAKFDDKKLQKDADFMVQATEFHLSQIKLAGQGIAKGNKETKALANYLMKEHFKSLEEAKKLATTKQISIPDTASGDSYSVQKELEPKSGNDFNHSYLERSVKSYQDIIAAYEKEASDSREQDLKEWAKVELPKLRGQLDSVFAVQKKIPEQ